jgi:(2Fe-2S) ferredoxin
MREYDRRFVYKRVFASRVDRSVQTHEGELRPVSELMEAEMVF